ncbi:F-actin-monooxygenase mical2b [Chanos chanos]|uniref:F-actin monooxygenase n=1 Tax=Chanos chanos TaxID=29144 RepID=A0A6J2WGZ4_CHACN|nr:protein-methionine sulfoxide oxidase mical2b-like [Chanos chanos]
MGETEDERSSQADQLFENFVQASTCKGTLQAFSILCRQLDLDPTDHRGFYSSLKAAVNSWKTKTLWNKLDKRASHKEYENGKACRETKCLIIGGGPCGLRTAIELALLGAKVVVVEKRDTFSRNNVLHLWPYTIHDLKALGAKKFYGKFCAGSIDHISIRQLQLMLLKISLIVGVEVHVNVEFVKLLEPPSDQENEGPGWRAEIRPVDHPVSDFDFDAIIGADGRRNTLDGFGRKEFRGKLAIAITANFVNRNTTAEAKVEEISGVAFIFNQKFFLDLKEETGIDLENIVYYKDNTHYFVMTAKKQSLLDKGVIIHDYIETERLLHSDNVNQEALLSYAREAADFGTNYQLPSLDYAINHYGQPDVAMFDFTCMYASENAALIRDKNGHQLLVALVGDSLLEPFWPMGTGCARGFLAAFDTAWMVRGWAQGKSPLEVLSERESIYRLLPQTMPENISKNFEQYTIDPATRYPNLNSSCVRPNQVRHLYINGEQDSCVEHSGQARRSVNLSRRESEVRPSRLLLWCQKQTQGYRGVDVTNLTSSWKNGLALCALIHRQRPDLIDFDSLNEADSAKNNQLAFDVAEREFGIQPVTTGQEMALMPEPDKLLMVLYLSKFYEAFHNPSQLITGTQRETDENNEDYSSKTGTSVNHFTNQTQPRKRIPKNDKKVEDSESMNRKRRKGGHYLEEMVASQSASSMGEGGELKENKVRSMATQLLAKFEENAPSCALRRQTVSDENLSVHTSLDMTENPRFAKPKDQPICPLIPPKPKWQPSPYLRLLESRSHTKNSTDRHSETMSEYTQGYEATPTFTDLSGPPPSFTHLTEAPPSFADLSEAPPTFADLSEALPSFAERSESPLSFPSHSETVPNHLRTLNKAQASPPVQTPHHKEATPTTDLSDPLTSPAVVGMFQRMQRLEDQISQRKAQTISTRDFTKKSIKEKALHLCSLFSGHQTAPPQEHGTCPTAQTSTPKSPSSVLSLPTSSALSCLLSPMPPVTQKQCSVSSEPCEKVHRRIDQPEPRPNQVEYLSKSKQRTVGRVSSVIGAKAETLAILYETDHRPNAPCSLSPVNPQREFPQNLGGSDTCHFCKKRVYVMERLSAEGHFFHRECFRCDFCNCTLRLGVHAYDSTQGKFYCKLHFSQRKTNFKKRKEEVLGGGVCTTDGGGGFPPSGILPNQSSGTLSSLLRKSLHWPLHVGHALFGMPRRLSRWMHGAAIAAGSHLRGRREDYAFLYELLSLGFPLLCALQEVLGQMSLEETPLSQPITFQRSQYEAGDREGDGDGSSLVSDMPEEMELSDSTEVISMSAVKDDGKEPLGPSSSHQHKAERVNAKGAPSSRSSYWRRKIRATLPLILLRSLDHGRAADKDHTGIEEEEDSDFEEIQRPSKEEEEEQSPQAELPQYRSHLGLKTPKLNTPSPKQPPDITVTSLDKHSSSSPKKKLSLSAFQKENLLNWEVPSLDQVSLKGAATEGRDEVGNSQTEDLQTKQPPLPQPQPEQEPHPYQPEPSHFLSGLQLLSSALRRSISRKSGSNTAVLKRNVVPKPRPYSEGSFNYSFMPGSSTQNRQDSAAPAVEVAKSAGAEATSRGSQSELRSGSEITALLEQVALDSNKTRTSKDDLASLPTRKLNFFSSLRLQRTEGARSGGAENKERDIWSILSKFRNKASTQHQQQQEEEVDSTSSEEDEREPTKSQNGSPERQQRKQEKLLIQQTKREQLRRLHRAQIIQRQLEEVEEKHRELEEKGVALEKVLRGETDDDSEDEAQLLQNWFKLVLEKNKLSRYERELMIFAEELELEDTQSQLQQELRRRMAIDERSKSSAEQMEEQKLLVEIMKVVEKRDYLVSQLEEQRLQERAEDRDLESLVLSKGYQFHWT